MFFDHFLNKLLTFQCVFKLSHPFLLQNLLLTNLYKYFFKLQHIKRINNKLYKWIKIQNIILPNNVKSRVKYIISYEFYILIPKKQNYKTSQCCKLSKLQKTLYYCLIFYKLKKIFLVRKNFFWRSFILHTEFCQNKQNAV